MPVIQPDHLIRIAIALLRGAGAPQAEAETVARLSIAANLAGHDSHGIIMIPSYIERMKVGHIVPGAPWTITQETPTTTVDRWQLGFRLRRHRARDAPHDRKGAHAERRGHHGVPPGPYRPSRLLSADGGRARA